MSTDTTPVHFHVAYSIGSYDPDGSEGFLWAETLTGVADLLSTAFEESGDMARDEAVGLAGSLLFEEAWDANERALDLWNRATNWDMDRRKAAPLYKDDPDALNASILRWLADTFGSENGGGFPVGEHRYLNVWKCVTSGTGDVCEHLTEED